MNRLDVCETCENKSFNSKKGVICGLTSEKPSFEGTCPDYKENPKAVQKVRESSSSPAQQDFKIKRLEEKVSNLQVLLGIIYTVWILSTGYAISKIYTFESDVEEATKE